MEGDSGVVWDTMLGDALDLHYGRPSLLLVVQKVKGENMKHHGQCPLDTADTTL